MTKGKLLDLKLDQSLILVLAGKELPVVYELPGDHWCSRTVNALRVAGCIQLTTHGTTIGVSADKIEKSFKDRFQTDGETITVKKTSTDSVWVTFTVTHHYQQPEED